MFCSRSEFDSSNRLQELSRYKTSYLCIIRHWACQIHSDELFAFIWLSCIKTDQLFAPYMGSNYGSEEALQLTMNVPDLYQIPTRSYSKSSTASQMQPCPIAYGTKINDLQFGIDELSEHFSHVKGGDSCYTICGWSWPCTRMYFRSFSMNDEPVWMMIVKGSRLYAVVHLKEKADGEE